jgi:glycosyltransferase involved in cell wall biosynthesis
MKILIDASQIPRNKGGVGTYAVQLIRTLAGRTTAHRYVVLVQCDEEAFDDLQGPNLKLVRAPGRIFRRLPFRFALEQIFLPFLLVKHRVDILHSLHYSFPLLAFTAKRVVTVHDLTFFKFPGLHTAFKRYYFRVFILLAARLADRIITISESTRRDFIDRTGADEDQVSAALIGAPEVPGEWFRPEVVQAFRRRHGIDGKYVLFVGTLEPRKNIKTLILAFDRLTKNGETCHLVIVGAKGWDYEGIFGLVRQLRIERHVTFTGFVGNELKFNLIRNAALFVYPSFYEGFGIPVLEALSQGIPTITSNVSALIEVAGDAALLVDPSSVAELCQKMKLLLHDDALRSRLAHQGVRHSKSFNWQRTAQQTEAVYLSLSHQNSPVGGELNETISHRRPNH